MVVRTHWANCDMDLSKNTIDHLTSINPYSSSWTTVTCWVTDNYYSETLSSSAQKVWLFPFSQCTVTLLKAVGPLGMARRKIESIYFGSMVGSLPERTHFLFHSKSSVFTNWLNSGNWLRGCDSVFMIWIRLVFTWPKTFLPIWIKGELSRLSTYFTSRNTMTD